MMIEEKSSDEFEILRFEDKGLDGRGKNSDIGGGK